MRQAIIWTNTDPIHLRIYAALGEMSNIDQHVAISWIKEPTDGHMFVLQFSIDIKETTH